MAPRIPKLENALARTEELVNVGQSVAALDLLSSTLLGTKFPMNYASSSVSNSATSMANYTPSTEIEKAILKLVDLCVSLRRGRLIKETLLHFRAVLQTIHPLSFEFVLNKLITWCEEGFKSVTVQSKLAPLDDVFDLEEDPSAICESSEREIITPWLRFYWEILRVALDIIRTSSGMESTYSEIVIKAFDFCREYKRKSEFRRLCEMIRHHLNLVYRFPNQPNSIPFNSTPESHQIALDLRFAQLALASELELWQEAFRSIEDIHGLLIVAHKSARQVMVVAYFEKIARIFLMSENFLFLAASSNRLFRIASKDPSSQSNFLIDHSAALTILSTLSIPNDKSLLDEKEKSGRLTQFLGLQQVPTRSALINDLIERNMFGYVDSRFKQLFDLLESTLIDNVSICHQGFKLVNEIVDENVEYRKFARPCCENLVSLSISRIFRLRDSIRLSELKDIVDFDELKKVLPSFNLELFLALNVKKGVFSSIKIDQANDLIHVDRSVFMSNPIPPSSDVSVEDTWSWLLKEMTRLRVEANEPLDLSSFTGGLNDSLAAEHRANLGRRQLMERRKERLAAALQEKERQEARERQLRTLAETEAEQRRQAEEKAKKERERVERERAEIRRIENEKKLALQEEMKEAAGARLNREKISASATRFDHLERALRAKEIPLLLADFDHQKTLDKAAYETRKSLIIDSARIKHDRELLIKQKFIDSSQTFRDYESFLSRIQVRRQREFEAAKSAAMVQLEIEKQKRRDRIAAELRERERIEAERKSLVEPIDSSIKSSEAPIPSAKYVPRALQQKAEISNESQNSWRRSGPHNPPALASSQSPWTRRSEASTDPAWRKLEALEPEPSKPEPPSLAESKPELPSLAEPKTEKYKPIHLREQK